MDGAASGSFRDSMAHDSARSTTPRDSPTVGSVPRFTPQSLPGYSPLASISPQCFGNALASVPDNQRVMAQRELFGNQRKDLDDYLLMALNTIATIEAHQIRFRNEFITYLSSIPTGQTATRKSRAAAMRHQENSEPNSEYVFFICRYDASSQAENAQNISGFLPGYHAVNLTAGASFIINFLVRFRPDADKYLSLLDLPRAIIRPLLEPALRARFPRFCDEFVSRIIHPASLDRIHWWKLEGMTYCARLFWPDSYVQDTVDDEQILDSATEGTLFSGDVSRMRSLSRQRGAFEGTDPDSLYGYRELYEQAAEEMPANLRFRPDYTALAQANAPFEILPQPRLESNLIREGLDPHRLSLTCYLYLAYAMAHPWVGAPHSAANRLVVSSPPPFHYAPYKDLNFSCVWPPPSAGDYKYTIAQLYPMLMAIVAGKELDPVKRTTFMVYMQDSGAVLLRLSELAADIVGLLVHERLPEGDLLARSKKLLLERLYARSEGLDRWSRVFRAACKRTFENSGPRDNRRQVSVTVERQVFGSFLRDLENQVCPLEQQRVHDWLAENTSVDVDTVLWAAPTFRPPVVDGMDLHKRAQHVLKHIQEADKAIMVVRFPANVSIVEVQTSIDYYSSLAWKISRDDVLIGNDVKGVYMLTEYHHYCILLQTMLTITVTTIGFRHNMPLFPLLARLYFSRIQPYSRISVFAPNPISAGAGDSLVVQTANDHALYSFVTILGHWLGLATNAPSDSRGPLHPDADETSVDGVYVPSMDHAAFKCLRLLHRFLSLFEETFGIAIHTLDKLTDTLAEAVAGFLEILRPRSIPVRTVALIIAQLDGKRPDTCRDLRQIVANVDENDSITLCTPWLVYSAMLERLLTRDIVRQLLGESKIYFAPVGRPVISERDLRRSCQMEEETIEATRKTRQYAAAYNRMFVVPFMPSDRVLGSEFDREPISPLAHFIRVLEASVAPNSLAVALGRDGVPPQDPEPTGAFRDVLSRAQPPFEELPVEFLIRVYDFERMLRGQHLVPLGLGPVPEDLEQWKQLYRERLLLEEEQQRQREQQDEKSGEECWNFDTLASSDCQSILPLHFWPDIDSASKGGHEQRHNIIYYEKFFSIVSFLGGTYAAHLESKGLAREVIAREAYSSDYYHSANSGNKRKKREDASSTFYHVPRSVSHLDVRHRMTMLLSSVYNASDTVFPSRSEMEAIFSQAVSHYTLGKLHAALTTRMAPDPSLPPNYVMVAQVIRGRPCLKPIAVSLANLPPHFPEYDSLCRYVSMRLCEPLPGETQPEYICRLEANRQNDCERSKALFSALARLYQSCGLKDFRTDLHNESNAFYLHLGSEPTATLEALTGAWIFLLDEIVKRGALRAARKRSRGTQSPLPH